jgi:organic radical activating enzyme
MIDFNEIVEAGDPNYNLLTFSWDLVDVCQYNCSYCASMNFNLNTFKNNPTLRYAWKIVLEKLKMKRIKSSFSVELLGGEPTMHPDIYEILEQLNKIENCIQIELITNLAKPLTFYQKLDEQKFNKINIIASYHPEYYTENYFNKVVSINNSKYIKIYPNINLPDDKNAWESTKTLIERFQNENVQVSINILQDVGEGPRGSWTPSYTPEFYEYFSKWLGHTIKHKNSIREELIDRVNEYQPITAEIPYKLKNGEILYLSEGDINRHNLRQFKGWSCKNLMYHISMDGTIKDHCTGDVLSLMDLNEKRLTNCVICPLEKCDCDTKFLYVKTKFSTNGI